MIKKLITTLSVAALSFIPTSAFAGPTLAYGHKAIGYSQFSCIQKAETKLHSISATDVHRNNNIHIYGSFPDTTISIMCRNNNEVFVSVAGKDAFLLRDEIMNYF